MFEEDLKIIENQIARAKADRKGKNNTIEGYYISKKIEILEDMRLDLLIQIENAREDNDANDSEKVK